MNIDLELFKKYFFNTHFNYKDEILIITDEIYNDKPTYIIMYEEYSDSPFYYENSEWFLGDYKKKYIYYGDKSSKKNSLIPPFNNWYDSQGILQEDIEIFKVFYVYVTVYIKFYPLYNKNISSIEKKYLFNIILILRKNEIPKEIIEYIITFLRRIDILKLSN